MLDSTIFSFIAPNVDQTSFKKKIQVKKTGGQQHWQERREELELRDPGWVYL